MGKCKEYCMNNTVTVGKDGSVDLSKILKGTNVKIEDVHYYEMENGGNGVRLTLFDKNKEQIVIGKRTASDLAKDIKQVMLRCSKTWFPADLVMLVEDEIRNG